MINIIYDFNDILKLNNAIEIIDNETFLVGREKIAVEKKNRFRDNIDLLIKKEKYSKGFEDLKELKDFVTFQEIDLKVLLEEELQINLMGTDVKELISTGIHTNLDKFKKSYLPKNNFFQNVIIYNFELNNLNDFVTAKSAIEFVLYHVEKINTMKKERNATLKFLKNELLSKGQTNDILWFAEILDYDTNTTEFIKCIIFNKLFENYKTFEKEILDKPSIYKGLDIDLSEEIYEKLLRENPGYIRKLNLELIRKEKQLYLFKPLSIENFSSFLRRSTGILEHEFDYAYNFILLNLLEDGFSSITDYEPLIYDLEMGFQSLILLDVNIKKRIELLKQFVSKLKIINSMEEDVANLDTIEDWFDFYTNKYMLVKNDLLKENNIYEIANTIIKDEDIRQLVKKRVERVLDSVNTRYEDFLYLNFHKVHTENNGIYSISTAITRLTRYTNDKIIFIVIDAMRWDIWEIAQEILEDRGYMNQKGIDFIVAMAPTVTSISRLALFSGNKYKTIIDEKMSNVYSFDYRNESKHFNRFFKGKNVGFAIGGKDKFNQLILKDRDIYTFIYSESDAVLHGLTDISRDIIYYILKEQLDNIIEKVEERFHEGYKIVLTTDHGTIDIKNSKGINIKTTIENYLSEHSIRLSTHGKYVRIFAEQKVKDEVYNELYEHFKELGYFNIIDKDNMSKYFLPSKESDGYNLFYLICKHNYHIGGTTRSSNTHGGLSMNETLVPFATMEKKTGDSKKLIVEVSGDFRYKEKSSMIIRVINQNDFSIKTSTISIMPFINNYQLNNIGPQSYTEFEVNIIPEIYGEVELDIVSKYSRLGETIENRMSCQIDIEEDLKTKISKDIKKSRRLDF